MSGESFREAMAGAARAQFAQAANTEPLRAYWVQHKRGFVVEAQFEALGADALACATDHAAPDGCRTIVVPLAEWREKQRVPDLTPADVDEEVRRLEADALYDSRKALGRHSQADIDAAQAIERQQLAARGLWS